MAGGWVREQQLMGYLADELSHNYRSSDDRSLIFAGEPWTELALADLATLGPAWHDLMVHAATATSTTPARKWDTRGRELLDAAGPEAFRDRVVEWLALVRRPRSTVDFYGWDPAIDGIITELFEPGNATILRGLAWLLSLTPPNDDAARALGGLVETALKPVRGYGPREPRVAGAAVHALCRTDDEASLAQLARLAGRITHKATRAKINAGIDARAAALGYSRDDVEELAVPIYGLTEVGRRTEWLGEVAADLAVHGGTAVLSWRTAAGTVKSPPAETRRDHPDQVKTVKAAAKDIGTMLTAQRDRLDRLFLANRTWPYLAWRERYLDHPLVGTLARRLIWVVAGRACAYADGALRTMDDTPLGPADDTGVTLWHPIDQSAADVVGWQEWLERHGVTQPFKQAHREVYVLTPAELSTYTYSNRFAAHILRQHQFHALAAVRGWTDKLRVRYDGHDPTSAAIRELPRWELRAEYRVTGTCANWETDLTASGAYRYVSTGDVRFRPADGADHDAVPLAEIPPLVLSEVMRDVDLFVGVASVGNDPTWTDTGPLGHRDYWESYSFGELSLTAQTRRDVVTRLLPRLAIGQRCTVAGRYLEVRGDLRNYKIHLGSGSIRMSPNDEHLCIVPAVAGADTGSAFLPFEGDDTLALIISKAMLLADDAAITDSSITSQIGR
jgi:hypothetical protein